MRYWFAHLKGRLVLGNKVPVTAAFDAPGCVNYSMCWWRDLAVPIQVSELGDLGGGDVKYLHDKIQPRRLLTPLLVQVVQSRHAKKQ